MMYAIIRKTVCTKTIDQGAIVPRINIGAMAYSDVVILDTLKDLIAQRGADAIITQGEISAASGASIATTQRALYRLMARGQIKGVRHIGVGNIYTIPQQTDSQSGTIPGSVERRAERTAGF